MLASAEALGIDIAGIDRRLAENWSLPTRFYRDPDIFAFEMEAIFAGRWQFLCPVHKVTDPGDVAVRRVGRFPVVVTRDREGTLHGFLNICRHRGYTVAERGRKACLRLVCRYHGWSYNLDGTLAGAPDAGGEAGFHPDELGLRRVAVDRWGPAVLVHPDPDARPLRETCPVMFETARKTGFDPDPVDYDTGTNWKLSLRVLRQDVRRVARTHGRPARRELQFPQLRGQGVAEGERPDRRELRLLPVLSRHDLHRPRRLHAHHRHDARRAGPDASQRLLLRRERRRPRARRGLAEDLGRHLSARTTWSPRCSTRT